MYIHIIYVYASMVYIYMYIYVCVCVCIWESGALRGTLNIRALIVETPQQGAPNFWKPAYMITMFFYDTRWVPGVCMLAYCGCTKGLR